MRKAEKESYRSEDKTDAKDAAVIADQVRIRRDLHPLHTGDETVTDLKILTGRRTDLVADRTRTVNRLRAQLTGIFPGLERALDLTNTGPLILLTGYQTPASLRRTGKKRLETRLRNRKVLRADQLAETAMEAAGRRHTTLSGEKLTAQLVHTLAREVIAPNQQVAELDKAFETRFREHRDFEVITSTPGLQVILSAEFLAATGGDMTASARQTASPASAASHPCPATPARSAATSAGHGATTVISNESSTSPRCSASAIAMSPAVLRTQASRRQAPHPGGPRIGPPPRQRPLGSPPRQTDLRSRAAPRSRGLTDRIRNQWGFSRGNYLLSDRQEEPDFIPALGSFSIIKADSISVPVRCLPLYLASLKYRCHVLYRVEQCGTPSCPPVSLGYVEAVKMHVLCRLPGGKFQ